jgi:hypothetical protein
MFSSWCVARRDGVSRNRRHVKSILRAVAQQKTDFASTDHWRHGCVRQMSAVNRRTQSATRRGLMKQTQGRDRLGSRIVDFNSHEAR